MPDTALTGEIPGGMCIQIGGDLRVVGPDDGSGNLSVRGLYPHTPALGVRVCEYRSIAGGNVPDIA